MSTKEICQTCFGSGKVTIYENAGFAYKGPPYKIGCPTCWRRRKDKADAERKTIQTK